MQTIWKLDANLEARRSRVSGRCTTSICWMTLKLASLILEYYLPLFKQRFTRYFVGPIASAPLLPLSNLLEVVESLQHGESLNCARFWYSEYILDRPSHLQSQVLDGCRVDRACFRHTREREIFILTVFRATQEVKHFRFGSTDSISVRFRVSAWCWSHRHDLFRPSDSNHAWEMKT